MYFPLVYDEYSSLPPLVLLRVRFFTNNRDHIKKSRLLGFLDEERNDIYEIGLSSNKSPCPISVVSRPKNRQLNCLSIQT